ncbi:MAG: YcaO-like family protein [Devosia sp.]
MTALSDGGGRAALYSDRRCPPSETMARLEEHLPALGITRVARQTGLDVIGIPCFAAIRPNAKTLATSMGKGLDDDAARASAIMEAAELAIAEIPPNADWFGSAAGLTELGVKWSDPRRLLQFGTAFDHTRDISWVAGKGLFSNRPVMIPRDAIRFDGLAPDLKGISQSTNGLASGNTRDEAEFHALCELIERDATTLWSLLPRARQADRAIASERFGDPEIDRLARRIRDAGLTLQLLDLTSDIAVPTVMALVGPTEAWGYFEVAGGTGTHPVAARAALRAITEAAQGRICAIAGSRDDMSAEQYEQRPPEAKAQLLGLPACAEPPAGLPLGVSLKQGFDFLRRAMETAEIEEPAVASLGGQSFGIEVVRVISDILEEREANSNWRPGPRSVTVMLEAA